jgi:hypothetical protein
MSIRKYTNPRDIDLSPGLMNVLHRNGMQAHIAMNADGQCKLIVLGHDSPVLEYNLTDKQVDNLMNWGSNYANKTAYNTFTSIVKEDFYMPDNFVSARNANGRVAMGLHGYRIGRGEYGRTGIPFYRPFSLGGRGWLGDFLGWSPRYQDGYHLRRIGGRVFSPYSPIVPERPDGRMKPGELRSGGYGFYYKGQQKETKQDVLDNLTISKKIQPLQAAPRPTGKAIPLSQAITSDVYFSNVKFQEVLASHGILIQDADKNHEKRVVIQAGPTKVDTGYTLTYEQYAQLTAPNAKGKWQDNVDARLAIINSVIGKDFDGPITREMLETKDLVSIDFKPEVKAELEAPFIERERMIAEQRMLQEARMQERQAMLQEGARIAQDPNAINGRDILRLMPGKGFYNSEDGGRAMVVGEIRVDKTAGEHYVMSAVINGEKVTHGITEKEYNKFLALDDAHRLKLFDKKFDELTIQKGDGRGGDDMYVQQGYSRQQNIATGEFRTKGVDNLEIIDFAKAATLGNFLATGSQHLVAGEVLKVSNIETYSVNDLLSKLTPDELKGIDKEKLADLQGKFVMTARVNGQLVTKELSAEQYDSFQTLSKADQLKFFNEVFNVKEGSSQRVADERIYITAEQRAIENARSNSVDGSTLQDLNEKKGFYREGRHGREVEVGAITVERDPQQEGKYKMTAVINGQSITHDITQKDYDKFMAVDDMQRMKLFSKIFNEVDMKTRPGQGVNIGAAILAAVVTAGNVALDISMMGHRPRPEFYESHYSKPGVVHPAEVAAAAFEVENQIAANEISEGRHRGL